MAEKLKVPKEEPEMVLQSKVEKVKSFVIGFLAQFLIVAVLFFGIGFIAGQKKIEFQKRRFIPKIVITNQTSTSVQNVDFSLFWQVFNTLPEKYLIKNDIDGQKMLYGAISGMVKSLGDPYTTFLDPKQNKSIEGELSGSYEGVGIQIGFNDKQRLVVMSPLKGTPAEAAGVKAKDLILKISDQDTFDMTLPDAVDLIRGSAGTRVKLTLQHEGVDKPYEIDVERAKINVKSVEVEYKKTPGGRDIALVKVSRFGSQTDDEWDSAINDAKARGVYGVVVDMRNNPGGLLTSAIHLSSEFITGTVVKQEFSDGSVQSLPTDHEGKMLKTPIVVIVNGGSASAAEIFAGAIKDSKRGKLVGDKTFGKGTVQDAVDFPGGSGLHVTIAKWLTPDGHSIHKLGIEPDVKIELGDEDVKNNKDSQLEKALETF